MLHYRKRYEKFRFEIFERNFAVEAQSLLASEIVEGIRNPSDKSLFSCPIRQVENDVLVIMRKDKVG